MHGQNRVTTLPVLRTLLDINSDPLAWQVENDRTVDEHYLKGALPPGRGELDGGI